MLVTFFFFKFFKYFTTVKKTKTIERMMTKFIIRRRWCSLGKLEYECDSEISLAWSWCLHFSLHQGWEQQQNWRPSSLSGFLRRDINEGFARGVKMQSSAQPSPSPQHPCNKNFRLYPLESLSPFLVDWCVPGTPLDCCGGECDRSCISSLAETHQKTWQHSPDQASFNLPEILNQNSVVNQSPVSTILQMIGIIWWTDVKN